MKTHLFILLLFLVLFGSCSGIGFGPNPEDLGDFPDTLPNGFMNVACDTESGGDYEFDLAVFLDSPTTEKVSVFSENDTIVLHQGNPIPDILLFETHDILGNSHPLDEIDFSLGHFFLTGRQFLGDGSEVSDEDIEQDLGTTLLEGSWTEPDIINPVLQSGYIPDVGDNHDIYDPDVYFHRSEFGLEGCIIFNEEEEICFSSIEPGLHRTAVRFSDIFGVQHCTKASMNLLVCPRFGTMVGFEEFCPPPREI